MIKIEILPMFEDNYSFLLQSPCGVNAIIDPGDPTPTINFLNKNGLKLDFIINTHHHWDHVDGNAALKAKYGAQIVAPEKEAVQIGDVDIKLKDGDIFMLGEEAMLAIETAGHTMGALCYYFADSSALFTGDTVFSMGCGRLFEGTAEDMFKSFAKIMALPDDTMIYCAHEYTRGNAGFCLSQDRDNEDLRARIAQVKDLRVQNKPTIPVSLAIEKKTNIFMKAKSAEEFSALRIKKDTF